MGDALPPGPGVQDSRAERFAAGLALAVLLVCLVVAERIGAARAVADTVRDAHGGAPSIGASDPEARLWLVTAFAGAVAAALVIVRVRAVMTTIGETEARLRFTVAASLAVLVWLVWLAGLGGTPAHLGAIALAVVAVVAARRALGDVGLGWKRAAVVRLQLIVVAALVALVFVVPLTAAQMAEVLRAWGDGPFTRVTNGVAAALVLGAVLRASVLRFLAPDEPEAAPSPVTAITVAVAVIAGLLAGGLAFAGAWLGAGVIAVAFVLAAITAWKPPKVAAVEEQAGERRLAATLGVAPLAIVVAGLAAATFDSFLLPAPATRADLRLLVFTVIAGLAFAWLAGDAQEDPAPLAAPRARTMFPAGLAAALAAGILPRELDGPWDFAWTLPLLALGFALAARVFDRHRGPELAGGAGVAVGVLVAVYLDPIGASRGLGTLGVALFGTAGIVLLLHVAGATGARRGLRWDAPLVPDRVPVVALLAVWAAVALAAQANTFHQARTEPSSGATPDLRTAVGSWLARQGDNPPEYLPLVVAGASGGGGKAAYWTDLVIDCAMGSGSPASAEDDECASSARERERLRRLFLTSSVSGGSAGIYHLLAQQGKLEAGQSWVDAAAGREVLSPITSWGLFHDLPLSLAGARADPRRCDDELSCRLHADRALVQEAAVADFRDDIVPPGNGRHVIEARGGPIPVFNAALNGGEGRALISPLALAPPRPDDPGCYTRPSAREPAAGSIDGHDVLDRRAGEDVPLVTAALLSARFPVVAPAGRLGDHDPGDLGRCDAPLPLPPVTLRDGGYVENTGLLTLTELLPGIRAATDAWERGRERAGRRPVHVQIVVVSIDDDASVLDAEPRVAERRGPGLGIAAAAGPAYLSRLARDRITSCRYRDVTYLRISPPPRTGARAATGWEVSRTAREQDLGAALAPGSPALGEVEKLRRILDGGLRPRGCARP